MSLRDESKTISKRRSNQSKQGYQIEATDAAFLEDDGANLAKESRLFSSKNLGWSAAKWAFAAILLYFVFRSGKISLEPIAVFFKSPVDAIPIVLLVWMTAFGSFFRWRWIMAGLGLPMSAGTAIRLGMTGQFFSMIVPGAVGGDLVKAVYLAKRYPAQKARAISSLFVDRVAGLMGMLILGAIAFLIELPVLQEKSLNTEFKGLMSMGWTVTAIGLAIVVALGLLPFLGRILPEEIPNWIQKVPFKRVFVSIYVLGRDYRKNYLVLWGAVGVSLFFHALNLWAMVGIAGVIFGPGPWGQLDTAGFAVSFVLGNCALSLPITPMGLGVGQIAFSELFRAAGAPSKSFGGDLITSLMIVQIALGILGALFFITYREPEKSKT